MIARVLTILSSAAVVVAVGHGVVSAQDGAETIAAGEALPADSSQADAKTPEQMVDESRAVVVELERSSRNVQRMLTDARAKRDVVKVLCLDDKLSQINVVVNSAADRVTSMDAATQVGDSSRAQHDYAVMGALKERGGALAAEANQCIGEDKGVVGGASLEVTMDSEIPRAETTGDTTGGAFSPVPNTVEFVDPGDRVSPDS